MCMRAHSALTHSLDHLPRLWEEGVHKPLIREGLLSS